MSRIIDNDPCLVKARDDEPAFIILGRDPAAVVAIQAWIDERERLINAGILPDGLQERHHIESVRILSADMRHYWPKSFGQRGEGG